MQLLSVAARSHRDPCSLSGSSYPRNPDSLYTDPGCKCPDLWVGVILSRYPSVIWRTNPVPVTAVFPEATAVHSLACMHAVPVSARARAVKESSYHFLDNISALGRSLLVFACIGIGPMSIL